jgi:hypothetical protein
VSNENILGFYVTMKNIFAMHSHHAESNHCNISKDFLSTELFTLNYVILNLLGKTATISILHDYINAVVFNE